MNKNDVLNKFIQWRGNWCLFAKEVLQVNLDKEQQEVLTAIQNNSRISVAAGTARGKDFVAAVAALCFLYLTPKWDAKGNLIENTKVALTAPTDRQIENVMVPEFTRLHQKAKFLPGRLVGHDIRTDYKEWFLTGFKADDKNTEAWSGFHAVNTMFIVTEASGIPELVFNAIEGNLQGNSRIVLLFNTNTSTGYAANSQREPGWVKFRLDCLTAPNVINKNNEIPGQINYDWVNDKVIRWCTRIEKTDFNEGEGDFIWECSYYRPNDLFRIKVRALFPKVSEDTLIPLDWVQLANDRYMQLSIVERKKGSKLGVDVAGMGRDSSVFIDRFENIVSSIEALQSAGVANHMAIAGKILNVLKNDAEAKAYIDTIGEGAGVFSRLQELNIDNAYSCKYSEAAKDGNGGLLNDISGVYEFVNMRAYLYWCVRDWLNPVNKTNACLPPLDELTQELTETKWKFRSDGKIIIEQKEELKKRLKRSPDYADALANTFYPEDAKKIYADAEY